MCQAYEKHFTDSISSDPLYNATVWLERLSNLAKVIHLIESGFIPTFVSLKTYDLNPYVMGFIASAFTD